MSTLVNLWRVPDGEAGLSGMETGIKKNREGLRSSRVYRLPTTQKSEPFINVQPMTVRFSGYEIVSWEFAMKSIMFLFLYIYILFYYCFSSS